MKDIILTPLKKYNVFKKYAITVRTDNIGLSVKRMPNDNFLSKHFQQSKCLIHEIK